MRRRAFWIRLALVAGALAALEIACRTGLLGRLTAVPPSEAARALVQLQRSGAMNEHLASTARDVAAALSLSIAAGFVAGVALHALPRLRRALDPLLASYYAVPIFAFYPLLMVVFGMNELPIVAIGFLYAVVAMVMSTLNGLDRIPPVLVKVARMHRMGRVATALRLQLPAAAPYLFTGLKLAVAYSFIGVIASEFILAGSGIGYAIAYAYNNFDNRSMYALMLLLVASVTAVNLTLHVWERRLFERRGVR